MLFVYLLQGMVLCEEVVGLTIFMVHQPRGHEITCDREADD